MDLLNNLRNLINVLMLMTSVHSMSIHSASAAASQFELTKFSLISSDGREPLANSDNLVGNLWTTRSLGQCVGECNHLGLGKCGGFIFHPSHGCMPTAGENTYNIFMEIGSCQLVYFNNAEFTLSDSQVDCSKFFYHRTGMKSSRADFERTKIVHN